RAGRPAAPGDPRAAAAVCVRDRLGDQLLPAAVGGTPVRQGGRVRRGRGGAGHPPARVRGRGPGNGHAPAGGPGPPPPGARRGAPALLLTVSRSTAVIVTVCVARGVGFGIPCVSGGALTASIIPAERRGEGLALFGVVVGVPSMVALPAGLWLAAHVGYGPVFAAGAAAALAAPAAGPRLPGHGPARGRRRGPTGSRKRDTHGPGGVLAGMRTPELARPSAVFSATAMAAGIVVTFLPLAATRATAGIMALALLIQPAVSTVTRW